jgi:hypothetical protein
MLDFSTLEDETIGCPETSVQICRSTLRNIPEERRSHLRSGGRQKSRKSPLSYRHDNLKSWDISCRELTVGHKTAVSSVDVTTQNSGFPYQCFSVAMSYQY